MKESEPLKRSKDEEIVDENDKFKEKVEPRTLWQNISYIKSHITVEPSLACFVMPSVLASLATQNLNLEKACRVNLNYGDEVCSALKLRQTENYALHEAEVQKLIASVQGWKSVVQTTIPSILMLFIGAWSDKTGKRKICILMPIIGEFLTCMCNIASTYFFYEIPVEWTVFMEAIFPAITGGWCTMFLGVFSYIGDVTPTESRTFRVGIVNMCMSVGFPIGMGLSGVLLRAIGYYGVFFTSALIYLINLIYTCFVLEESARKTTCDREIITGIAGHIRCFFDLGHVKDTMRVAFKRGPRNRRLKVSLLLVVFCLIFGPMWGEMTVMYLFTRYRFNWDEVKYSIYSTYSIITHSVGTLFSISFLSRHLRLDDSVLGIISTSSKIAGAFVLAFARTDMEIFMAPLIEIMNGTSFIAMRSIATKLVSGEELGKINSLFGLAETMMPLVYGPLYSRVYMATLAVMPGAVFLVGAALTVPAVMIFGWLFREHKKDLREKNNEEMDLDKSVIK